jgi:hypothetical protein
MWGETIDPRFIIGMVEPFQCSTYTLVEIRPYRRRDGGETFVMAWRTRCVVCGAEFEATIPQDKFEKASRRCPQHRRSRK